MASLKFILDTSKKSRPTPLKNSLSIVPDAFRFSALSRENTKTGIEHSDSINQLERKLSHREHKVLRPVTLREFYVTRAS